MKKNATGNDPLNTFTENNGTDAFMNKISSEILNNEYELYEKNSNISLKNDEEKINMFGSYLYMFSQVHNIETKQQVENFRTYITKIFPGKKIDEFLVEFMNYSHITIQKELDKICLNELEEFYKLREKDIDLPLFESNKFISIIENLLKYSVIPVKLSVDLLSIIKKSTLTCSDILKINSAITNDIEYTGYNAINYFYKLYGNKYFQESLKKSANITNYVKQYTLYYEVILTYFEQNYENSVINYNNILLGDISMFSDECPKSETSEVVKENNQTTETPKEVNLENSAETIVEIVKEFIKNDNPVENFDEQTFVDGIKSITKNLEYMQDVYKYIKKSIHDKNIPSIDSINSIGLNFLKIKELLDGEVQNLKDIYKEKAEIICRELEKTQKTTINSIINEMIGTMILSSDSEKQYLISQFYDSSLTTVQHVIQIMNLIETGKMKASIESLRKYNNLYHYVNEEFGDDFQKVSDINDIFNEQSFIKSVSDLIDQWNIE